MILELTKVNDQDTDTNFTTLKFTLKFSNSKLFQLTFQADSEASQIMKRILVLIPEDFTSEGIII